MEPNEQVFQFLVNNLFGNHTLFLGFSLCQMVKTKIDSCICLGSQLGQGRKCTNETTIEGNETTCVQYFIFPVKGPLNKSNFLAHQLRCVKLNNSTSSRMQGIAFVIPKKQKSNIIFFGVYFHDV
eukprot:TRINITY_DN11381_c0_g1_i3.p6 TRINITY_DN11381_c0_g1~~TRINITY_DN11381_c0_g1_i3.p6  ORF type:complete len:125 (-),score=2.84 TRINITY_DN11381_c0_g1_i3:229-603(-)